MNIKEEDIVPVLSNMYKNYIKSLDDEYEKKEAGWYDAYPKENWIKESISLDGFIKHIK